MDNLPETFLGQALTGQGKTLSLAESCTGGLIAHRVTSVPGASSWFLGGVVAYSNEAKAAFLGVKEATLAEFGAVSEPVARELAEGARQRFRSDFAAGVTGIAGPTGGTPEKPVGLVYIAVAGPDGTAARRCVFEGSRDEVKRQTAGTALAMLLERVG